MYVLSLSLTGIHADRTTCKCLGVTWHEPQKKSELASKLPSHITCIQVNNFEIANHNLMTQSRPKC